MLKVSLQYNSYTTHFKEAECLRQQVEPFLYNFGVDIVFHGEPPTSLFRVPQNMSCGVLLPVVSAHLFACKVLHLGHTAQS